MAEQGDQGAIRWLHRDDRYAEKLATPGHHHRGPDRRGGPHQVAEGPPTCPTSFTLHYGLVPRVNRGIFAINEMPDLAERIQVGLLNLLEERDVQIRGHRVSPAPGRHGGGHRQPEGLHQPGAHHHAPEGTLRRHDPAPTTPSASRRRSRSWEQEADIDDLGDYHLEVPGFMKEIVAEIVHHARRSPDVNQRSGVSVRASISLYEALVANAFRRALRTGESEVVPRGVRPALRGARLSGQDRVRVHGGRPGGSHQPRRIFTPAAVKTVFDRHYDVNDLESVAAAFAGELVGGDRRGTPAGGLRRHRRALCRRSTTSFRTAARCRPAVGARPRSS